MNMTSSSYTGASGLAIYSVDLYNTGGISTPALEYISYSKIGVGLGLQKVSGGILVFGGQEDSSYTNASITYFPFSGGSLTSSGLANNYLNYFYPKANAFYCPNGTDYIYVLWGSRINSSGQLETSNDVTKVKLSSSGFPQTANYIGDTPTPSYGYSKDNLAFVSEGFLWVILNEYGKAKVYNRKIDAYGNFSGGSTWIERTSIDGYTVVGPTVSFSNDSSFVFLIGKSLSGSYKILRGKIYQNSILEWWVITPDNLNTPSQISSILFNNNSLYCLVQQTGGTWGWYSGVAPVTGAYNYDISENSPNIYSTGITFNYYTSQAGGNASRTKYSQNYSESYQAAHVFPAPTYNADASKPFLSIYPFNSLLSTTLSFRGYVSDNSGDVELRASIDNTPYTTAGFLDAYPYWTFSHTGLSDGYHTVRVRATDTAGNFSEINKTILMDNTGPDYDYIYLVANTVKEVYSDFTSGIKSIKWTAGTGAYPTFNFVYKYTASYDSGNPVAYGTPSIISYVTTDFGTSIEHYLSIYIIDGCDNITVRQHALNPTVAESGVALDSEKTIEPYDDGFEDERPGNLIYVDKYKDLLALTADSSAAQLYYNTYCLFPLSRAGASGWKNHSWDFSAELEGEEESTSTSLKKYVEYFIKEGFAGRSLLQGVYAFAFYVADDAFEIPDPLDADIWTRVLAGGDDWTFSKGYKVFTCLSEAGGSVNYPYMSHFHKYTDESIDPTQISYVYGTGSNVSYDSIPVNTYYGTMPHMNFGMYYGDFPLETFSEADPTASFSPISTGGYQSTWELQYRDTAGTWQALASGGNIAINSLIPYDDYFVFDYTVRKVKGIDGSDIELEYNKDYTFRHKFSNYYAQTWYGNPNNAYPPSDSVEPRYRWPYKSFPWEQVGTGNTIGVYGANIALTDAYKKDNLVFFGGKFYSINGKVYNNIAKYDETTQLIEPLGEYGNYGVANPKDGDNSPVGCLYGTGNYLYVGGDFTKAGSVSTNFIARYDISGNTWEGLGCPVSDTYSYCNAILQVGNILYVAFTDYSSNHVLLYKYDLVAETWGSLLASPSDAVNYRAFSLEYDAANNIIYLGGCFNADIGYGDKVYLVLYYNLDLESWNELSSWSSISGRAVYDLKQIAENDLYVCGYFSYIGAVRYNNIARYNVFENKFYTLGTLSSVGLDTTADGCRQIGTGIYVYGDFDEPYPVWSGKYLNQFCRYDTYSSSFEPISSKTHAYTGASSIMRIIEKDSTHAYVVGGMNTVWGLQVNDIAVFNVGLEEHPVEDMDTYVVYTLNLEDAGAEPPVLPTGKPDGNLENPDLYSTYKE